MLVPPPMEFFARRRAEGGSSAVVIAMGALEIELRGLDAGLATDLRRRYEPYVADRPASPAVLRVALGLEPIDYFIEPAGRSEFARVLLAADGERVRYMSYRVAGWFEVAGGRGELLLSRGSFEPELRALENYVRAAVAWQAASRGGALVHAASAVRDGAGYLFYGESGAGKSTLSACSRRGQIVSDDLSLVLPGEDGKLVLVGSPFRGTYEGGAPVQGSYPLRAGFRLIQAPQAAVVPVARPRALAELVGNLPFVAEAFGGRPDLFERVQRAFAGVPLAHLRFRKDDSFWDAITAAGY
jgi:hypothetical protein